MPIYGMNRGSVGFLMNDYSEDDLQGRLARAEINVIHPLAMRAVDAARREHEALAINEVSLFRQTYQAAKLRISIDGQVRLEELICDGVLVATPAGSTAYNLSALRPDPADQRAAAGADARSARSGRGAGAARCCPTRPRSASTCWRPTSGRSARWPTTPRRAR